MFLSSIFHPCLLCNRKTIKPVISTYLILSPKKRMHSLGLQWASDMATCPRSSLLGWRQYFWPLPTLLMYFSPFYLNCFSPWKICCTCSMAMHQESPAASLYPLESLRCLGRSLTLLKGQEGKGPFAEGRGRGRNADSSCYASWCTE